MEFAGPDSMDIRKMTYEYYFIDYNRAALPDLKEQSLIDRSVFIYRDIVGTYPDLLQDENGAYVVNSSFPWYKEEEKDHRSEKINFIQARAYYLWHKQKSAPLKPRKNQNPIGIQVIPTLTQWRNRDEYLEHGALERMVDIPQVYYHLSSPKN